MIALPGVIGHRGAAAVAPENTLAGIRAAADAGAAWVEFDVQLSLDGVCILLHDDTLRRTAGLRRRASAVPYDRIAGLDAGGWFSDRFAGEKVPTLDQALDEVARLGLGANIEIKPDRARADPVAQAVIRSLVTPPARRNLPVLISSRDERMLEAVRRIDESVPLGLLLRRRRRDWLDIARRMNCETIICKTKWLGRNEVEKFRAAGFDVAAFTVNDPKRAVTLIEWGVSSVITDVPGELLGHAPAVPGRAA